MGTWTRLAESMTRGMVVLVGLDPIRGHGQSGMRPCIAVSDPAVAEDQRFPMVCVVPVTRTPGSGALYPSLGPGESGLRAESHALVDQVRSVDKRRIRKIYGTISAAELRTIDLGLHLFLGLS